MKFELARRINQFKRLLPGRRTALLRAVEAGELTRDEIAREFGCSRKLVDAAAFLMGKSRNQTDKA